MAKVKTVFRCTSCGAGVAKWAGRCSTCNEWNTLVEELDGPATAPVVLSASQAAVPIDSIDPTNWSARSTGIPELDRVLGGGFVPGSVTLLGGEPGIGKSTLVLQLLASLARSGLKCLLVSGEESTQQVRLRAERLRSLHSSLYLASETSLPQVLGHIEAVAPDVVVIDSIQTMMDPAMSSSAGSVGQVRECANTLAKVAKDRHITTILIGHVTKEGALAGPRVLEHLVDTVLSFEGDRHHALRLLRAVKHRFGSTGELGLFEMAELGLIGVEDPGALFLGDRKHGAPGSVVACAMEGHRPLLVEAQALVTDSSLAMPRRNAQGFDSGRLALLVAVLQERANIKLFGCDVFASVVGGVKLNEPAGDLALALALASAWSEQPLPTDLVAIGEIGLAGEVRSVTQASRRLSEAARLGFKQAVVPASTPDVDAKITLIRIHTLFDAVRLFDFREPESRRKARQSRGSGGGQGNGGGGNQGGGRGGSRSGSGNHPTDSDDLFAPPIGGGGGSRLLRPVRGENYDLFADRSEQDPGSNEPF